MSDNIQYNKLHILKELQEIAKNNDLLTYVSLFSSAGVGCYGFHLEGYKCIATAELIQKRIDIQKYNKKCPYESGYFCADMTNSDVKKGIIHEIEEWKRLYKITCPDVLIATPPCQGMSVANHKKNPDKEIKRNSLVIESINMTLSILPKVFVFENVRSFLDTICVDIDEKPKSIKEAIDTHLANKYHILYRVINFKDYGNKSSRTRTLVIGTRKDLKELTPFDIFPNQGHEVMLKDVIGHLPALHDMGEISENDIFHSFRKYNPVMRDWIKDLKEGESAFDNSDPKKRPHTIKDGKIVFNVQKNGDKYTRQKWDKVAPCIHTRNDILASQNTIHPTDDRVFSIRELMLMMSIPESFKWAKEDVSELNQMSTIDKDAFLKKNEINIRQTIGEAVPTIIFQQIASKYRKVVSQRIISEQDIKKLIQENNLLKPDELRKFISNHKYLGFEYLSKIAELSNAERDNTAAYYTSKGICYEMVKTLPSYPLSSTIRILEPSVGVGNFLPLLFANYSYLKHVDLDVVDINGESLKTLKVLLEVVQVPDNFTINFIESDFLLYDFGLVKYDIIIGNPPYMQIREKSLLNYYRFRSFNQITNNIFAFFIEACVGLGNYISLVVPKSLINAPEFAPTRNLMSNYRISNIIDFGEKGFKGVKIETVAFTISKRDIIDNTNILSYITESCYTIKQSLFTDDRFPYWLLYRDEEFSSLANKMIFDLFTVFRDRQITKKHTKNTGRYRVLKSRNIGNLELINLPQYDSYIDDVTSYSVGKFLDRDDCVLVPNLTYNPRGCWKPKGCIADGSVAILEVKGDKNSVTDSDIQFWSSEEFRRFYSIARNKGTRSLNIDNSSVFFFGKLKNYDK